MVAGMPVHVLEEHVIPTACINLFESSRQPIILAENEQKKSNGGRKPQTGNGDQNINAEKKFEEKNGKTENEASKKPMRPFKPSEEIAAEQAVDFPWDI